MKGLFKGQVLKLEIGTYIKEVFENDLFSGIKESGCKRELWEHNRVPSKWYW